MQLYITKKWMTIIILDKLQHSRALRNTCIRIQSCIIVNESHVWRMQNAVARSLANLYLVIMASRHSLFI